MAPGAAQADDREDLAHRVLAGERRALARAITLVESTRIQDRAEAEALLARLLPATGGAMRIGISGAPGVGKSTFIEAFGLYLIEAGHRPAVLAVDPSSVRSGGSILGDKTRMGELARRAEAFIRPSPAGRTAGGVARRTREALLVCEAAGFDVVLVETVGVGQSETAVAEMVDLFLLLLAPGAGDELQGIKRGIIELADLVVVNKADGALAPVAGQVAADYQAAIGLLRPATPRWEARVLQVSALEGRGIETLWRTVEAYRAALGADALGARRAAQAKDWMWREVGETLMEEFRRAPRVAQLAGELEGKVASGAMTPGAAVRLLLAAFRGEE